MVSSRRLAREWALKILYQIDVGSVSVVEAQEAAIETLRREFVQRGSRSTSGSKMEEIMLEYLTDALRDTLPTLRLPLERSFSGFITRLCEEAPCWQESLLPYVFQMHVTASMKQNMERIYWMRLERRFRKEPLHTRVIPLLTLNPLSDTYLMPVLRNPSDGLSVQVTGLEREDSIRFRRFAQVARDVLPRLLETEMWEVGYTFARNFDAVNRDTPYLEVADRLHAAQKQFNQEMAEQWRKIGSMVQKQVADWLRTSAFTIKLVQGVRTQQKEIDAAITGLSSGWRLERQVAVDRNILRMAGFEMLFLPGIPTAASINEAVELAKKYSTTESGRFVNGVLGALAGTVGDKLTPPPTAQDAIESDTQDDILDLPDITDIEERENA